MRLALLLHESHLYLSPSSGQLGAEFCVQLAIRWCWYTDELATDFTSRHYRVGLVVWQLGWVDLDLECSTILLGQ